MGIARHIFGLAGVLCSSIFCGCRGGNPKFADDLEKLGFLTYAPDPAKAKQELLTKGWSGIFGETGRFFFADSEDLAEGGIGNWIKSLTPVLEKLHVVLPEIKDEFAQDYYVIVGNARVLIWSKEELAQEDGKPGLTWGLASARAFGIVNGILKSSGTSEQLYAVSGGNDLSAILLTPDLFDVITKHPDAVSSDGPYILNEQYPLFGQPK